MYEKRRQKPREMFERQVPRDFIRDWLMALAVRNKVVRDDVANRYSPEAGHFVASYARRGIQEDALFDLGAKHGGRAKWVWNKTETHQHVEVTFGRVVLTQHLVREEDKLPRFAFYRDSLARETQMTFEFLEGPRPTTDEVPTEGRLYAQLLHGLPHRATGIPAFARVVFPIAGTDRIEDSIDLTRQLTSLFYKSQRVEHIGDELELELKPVPKEHRDDD